MASPDSELCPLPQDLMQLDRRGVPLQAALRQQLLDHNLHDRNRTLFKLSISHRCLPVTNDHNVDITSPHQTSPCP